MWLAVGSSTGATVGVQTKVIYSYDGINWSGQTNTLFNGSNYGVAWNGTLWVIGGTSSNARLAYSYDGFNWSASTNGNTIFTSYAYNITWGNDKFIVGGFGTNSMGYSYDGITWSASTNGNTLLNTGQGVSYDGSNYFAGGRSFTGATGSRIIKSTDGITWSATTNPNVIFTGTSGVYPVIYKQPNINPTPTPTPSNTATPTVTPTNTTTPTITPSPTNNPLCPEQIIVSNSGIFDGTYDRTYSYTGGTFVGGTITSGTKIFTPGPYLGNEYAVYTCLIPGTFFQYLTLIYATDTVPKAFTVFRSSTDYIINQPTGSTSATIVTSLTITDGSVLYPKAGDYITADLTYPASCPTPTPTTTPTNTPTPSITPTYTPTPTLTPTPTETPLPLLTFLITSGQSEYDACNGVSGTIYASDIGNCGGCYAGGLNCLACLTTTQGIYIDSARTILAPNAYYANEMAPGNFAIIEVRNGSEVASGFQGGCPGSPPSPPTGAHPYMFTGYSANTIVSSYCDAYTGGTPCTLYGDYPNVDENTYLYNVSSGSSTTNLFGSYSMRNGAGGTGPFICFYLDSYGQNTSVYQSCTSSC